MSDSEVALPKTNSGGKRSATSSFLIRLTTISSLGGMLFGFDTGVISGALIYLQQDFGLTSVEEGLVVTSILFPGATAGALLGGPLADRIGRKLTLVACAVIFTLGSLGCALSTNITAVVVARIVLGFAVGAASVAVPLYLAEMAPANHRGRMVTINQLMIVVGLFLAFLSNVILARIIDDPSVWRYMVGIAVVPAIALFVGMLILPDTPRWYASKGRLAHCLQTLMRAHDAKQAEFEYEQIAEVAKQDAEETKSTRAAMHALVAHPWMRRMLWIGITLAVAQQTTGINVVMYYAPTVLLDSGLTSSASLVASLVLGIEMIVLTMVGLWVIGFMARRKMMLLGFTGVAVSHALLALTYFLPESTLRSYLILLFMLSVSAMMVIFLGTTVFVVLAEIFPLPIRGFGMGASLASLWVANAVISFAFPLLAEQMGSIPIYVGFMVLNILVVLFVARFVPETKGRTLEELESDLRTRYESRA